MTEDAIGVPPRSFYVISGMALAVYSSSGIRDTPKTKAGSAKPRHIEALLQKRSNQRTTLIIC